MYDSDTPLSEPAAEAASCFLTERADALLSAAELLGGGTARRRTGRLIRDLAGAPCLTRRLRAELVALHRLLSLQDVDDLESDAAAFFAAIDPANPAVEEICLLTDALTSLLEALADMEIREAVALDRVA